MNDFDRIDFWMEMLNYVDHVCHPFSSIYTLGQGFSNSDWLEGHILEKKMLHGPQLVRKKLLQAAKYKKSPQNKLNLIKLYTLVIF